MPSATSDLLSKHFADAQEAYSSPSLAYGFSIGDELVAGSNTATPFRIASMTKSFVAVAVMILRDRGQVILDKPVREYVPELHLRPHTSDCPEVTVRDLLTMRSGLATDDPWADRHLNADRVFLDHLLSVGGHFAQPPLSVYCYSNYGYVLLGEIVSRVTQMSFQRFVSDEVLALLSMTHTTWDRPADAALPHRRVDDRVVAETQPPLVDGYFAAMGGLWSTVDDLMKWMRFFADAFPARDDADSLPLRRSTRREMQQVHALDPGKKERFMNIYRKVDGGYGIGLKSFHDTEIGRWVCHSGGLPGYGSNMIWNPDTKTFLVSLANITYAPMWFANNDALELLHRSDLLPETSFVTPPIIARRAHELVSILNEWDDETARSLFSDNVDYDETFARRIQRVAEATGGRTIEMTCIKAANSAVATIETVAGTTELIIEFSLSSQVPPLIQEFSATRR